MDSIQRFRIDGVLGEGGMGTVYRAFDPELERAVAIKVLAAPAAKLDALDEHRTVDLRDGRPLTENEILAEARMMAAISHPNVLPIFEVGRIGDKVFLVMELIDGIDLRRWLAAAPRSVREVISVLVDGARGLAAAHARGIVHGDFKPDNLLIGGDGRVRVADFGVSSFVTPTRPSMVRVDDARGTPAYLAPEVWRGEARTAAADVFAFATTAAEAFLGALPGEALDEVAAQLDARGVPAQVRDVIASGLSREPVARPTDLVGALTRAPVAKKPGWVIPVVAGTALAAVAVGVFIKMRGEERSCDVVPPANVWSPARAATLRATKVPDVEKFITTLDERIAAEGALRGDACRERSAGKLGSVEYAGIEACLDRTLIEYDERLRIAIADPQRAPQMLRSPPDFDDCRTRRDPPLDPVKQRALAVRFLAAMGLSNRDEQRRELAVLPQLALDAGDHEIASRSSGAYGIALANQRDLAGARAAMEKARAYAQQAGALQTELRTLNEHMDLERFHDELAIARLLANDAKVLLERIPKTKLAERAMAEIAQVAEARAEFVEARDYGRRLLAVLEGSKRGDGASALEQRMRILRITGKIDEPLPRDYKTFVEESYALLEKLHTDKTTSEYRVGLFAIAGGYQALNDPRGTAVWDQALEILRTSKPARGASEISHRAMLAGELFLRQRRDEAIDIMREVARESAKATTHDVDAARRRDEHLAVLALMLYQTNQLAEAHAVGEDALLEVTGKVGPTHKKTQKVIDILISIELSQGDIPRAEKHIEALDRAVRTDSNPIDNANVMVNRASLARIKGDHATAEKLGRQAITTLDEVKAKSSLRKGASHEVGSALVAMHREKEALPFFLDALPSAKEHGPHSCVMEFELARVERVVGKRAEGDARTKRCIEELKPLRGFDRDRKAAETWLAAP